jgi:hypothetical protein
MKELEETLGVLEMSGRKTIKIADVRYFLEVEKGREEVLGRFRSLEK